MRVRVIKDFIDKETKALHKANTETDITKRRFEEINSTAYGVFVEEIEETKPIKKTAKK